MLKIFGQILAYPSVNQFHVFLVFNFYKEMIQWSTFWSIWSGKTDENGREYHFVHEKLIRSSVSDLNEHWHVCGFEKVLLFIQENQEGFLSC